MKILTFAGSLQENSLNRKVVRAVEKFCLSQTNTQVEVADLKKFSFPLYDGDLEKNSGLPEGVKKFGDLMLANEALIISSPEYNGSISGVLKNCVDWLSRQKPNPLAGKHVLLCSASPGALGGVRGLWHTRVPFEALGCHVYPDMIGFPKAHELFGNENQILDEKVKLNFEKTLSQFISYVIAKQQ